MPDHPTRPPLRNPDQPSYSPRLRNTHTLALRMPWLPSRQPAPGKNANGHKHHRAVSAAVTSLHLTVAAVSSRTVPPLRQPRDAVSLWPAVQAGQTLVALLWLLACAPPTSAVPLSSVLTLEVSALVLRDGCVSRFARILSLPVHQVTRQETYAKTAAEVAHDVVVCLLVCCPAPSCVISGLLEPLLTPSLAPFIVDFWMMQLRT